MDAHENEAESVKRLPSFNARIVQLLVAALVGVVIGGAFSNIAVGIVREHRAAHTQRHYHQWTPWEKEQWHEGEHKFLQARHCTSCGVAEMHAAKYVEVQ